jgi:hypothetical protein
MTKTPALVLLSVVLVGIVGTDRVNGQKASSTLEEDRKNLLGQWDKPPVEKGKEVTDGIILSFQKEQVSVDHYIIMKAKEGDPGTTVPDNYSWSLKTQGESRVLVFKDLENAKRSISVPYELRTDKLILKGEGDFKGEWSRKKSGSQKK